MRSRPQQLCHQCFPNPAGFFVLNISRPNVQASCVLHSLGDGVLESQGISVWGFLWLAEWRVI